MSTQAQRNRVIDQVLCDSVVAVFGDPGEQLTMTGASPVKSVGDHEAVALIGFTGKDARGTLVVATSINLVTRICARGDTQPPMPADRARDWIGDLGVLILDQIKGDLSDRGVALALSLPIALTGQRLSLGSLRPSRTRAWDFNAVDTCVRAWLEAEFSSEVDLQPAGAAARDPAAATLSLF